MKPLVTAQSVGRYRATAAERRKYGGTTVTVYDITRNSDGVCVNCLGFGRTVNDRKADAIARSGLLPASAPPSVVQAPIAPASPARPLLGWLGTLDEETRERVFAVMRELDAEVLQHFECARETPGTLAVGAGLFDEFLQGAVREIFVISLGRGATPSEACEKAKTEARIVIAKHNAKRTDHTWKRWEGAGDGIADRVAERFAFANKL